MSRVPLSSALSGALRTARDARGLFRRQLAEQAGVTLAFVKIAEERLTGTVDETHLRAVMAVLGIEEIPESDPEPELLIRWSTQERMIPISEEFRCVLVYTRKTLGLSQREVAFRAKIASSTICKVEQGQDARNSRAALEGQALCRWLTALEVTQASPLGLKARAFGLRWVTRESRNIDWDAQPLGKIPDTDIARELGVQTSRVWKARKQRGIPAVDRSEWAARTKTVVASEEVPSILDREVPRHPDGQVNWDEVPLGEVVDRVVAKWAGVTGHTVGYQRRKRDIAPARTVIVWEEQPLGEAPDTAIAKDLGVSVSAVGIARRRRGIPAAPPETRRSSIFVER